MYTRNTIPMAQRKRASKAVKDESAEVTSGGDEVTQDPDEKERVTVVTEVVEVVEGEPMEGDTQSASAKADEEASSTESINEEVSEEAGDDESITSVATPEPETKMDKEEKQKDVVEGLFRRDTTPVTPEITIHRENKRLPLGMWIVIVVVVAALVGGGLIWATGSAGSLGFLSSAKPTPTPTQTPAPTAAPTVAREDITIQVLNGGGTPGAAGRMKTFLEEKGYTVSDTGNTEEYTYTTTDILAKPDKEAYLELLRADLESDYTLGTVAATLAEDVAFDVQVIVGEGE